MVHYDLYRIGIIDLYPIRYFRHQGCQIDFLRNIVLKDFDYASKAFPVRKRLIALYIYDDISLHGCYRFGDPVASTFVLLPAHNGLPAYLGNGLEYDGTVRYHIYFQEQPGR